MATTMIMPLLVVALGDGAAKTSSKVLGLAARRVASLPTAFRLWVSADGYIQCLFLRVELGELLMGIPS